MSHAVGPAVRVRRVSKTFPGVRALRGLSLEVAVGEVHGLVGENGAGKSTLIKLIAGVDTPDEGTIELFGATPEPGDPRAAAEAGVATIHQELTTVPQMSAAANVFLGRFPSRHGVVFYREARDDFVALAHTVGVDIDPRADAGSLPVAQQQILEIMRALAAQRKLLIMDEPTASLGHHEREALYRVVRDLKRTRHSVVFISHDLDEVLALCDSVSVLRDGQLIASRTSASWTKDSLVESMLGESARKSLEGQRERRIADRSDEEPALRVEDLDIPGVLHGVNLSVGPGEIVGIGGLVGAGRTEVLRALAGAEPAASGRMWIKGKEMPWPRTVRDGLRRGIALAPEDRKRQGLVIGMDAARNIALSDLPSVANRGVLGRGQLLRSAAAAAAPLGFKTDRLLARVATLSGGNQQKVVVAKWLHRRPNVLLLDEPTKGIDIGAKAEMYEFIRRLAAEGMSIVIVSSELEEVVELSDRVCVMARGRGLATLVGAEATVERILSLVFQVEDDVQVPA